VWRRWRFAELPDASLLEADRRYPALERRRERRRALRSNPTLAGARPIVRESQGRRQGRDLFDRHPGTLAERWRAMSGYTAPFLQMRSEHNNKTYDALVDDFDLLLSYATSAREAAWRGDGWLLGEYVRQVRAGIIEIIHKHKQLDLVQSEKDWRTRCADKQGATIAESGPPR
jgi:hypothetical protein